jgi:homoserine dehydrogenase
MRRNWGMPSSCWRWRAVKATGLQLRVHPALVPADTLMARVDGRMNGIMVKGNAAG